MLNKQDWIKKHYLTEKEWARKILAAPKSSEQRNNFLAQGYNEINTIMSEYGQSGGSVDNSRITYNLIKKIKDNKARILDFGCGEGNLIYFLAKAGYDVMGFDVSDVEIKKAKKKLKEFNAEHKAIKGGYKDIKGKFDIIIMNHVFEHIAPDEIDDIIQHCYSLLDKGGYFFISTPHPFSGPHDVSKFFVKIGQPAQGFHFKEYTNRELKDILLKHNFRELYGYIISPFFLSKLNVVLKPSKMAFKENLFLEMIFSQKPFKYAFRINRFLARLLTALMFPGVVIAKRG